MSKVENLFNALREDEESVFYAADQITKNLINRAKKSHYPRDNVFVNIYNEDKNLKQEVVSSSCLPLTTPFILRKGNVDRSTLYSFKGPFEALQADIADIRFLAKPAVNPHYCLLFVDLFTNMTHTYPMKKRKQLANKTAEFYEDIESQHSNQSQKMRLQTDLEFQQNTIKHLNEKYNVEMHSTKLREGKAFAAEQKIREFKKILLKSKIIIKDKGSDGGERLNPKEIIRKATSNMNKKLCQCTTLHLKQFLKKVLIQKPAVNFNKYTIFIDLTQLANDTTEKKNILQKLTNKKGDNYEIH